ncbi:MAG TPA: hypothetical protein VHK64_03370 [Nocardioidaceae bacterium]|jgi:hypothetical protein|nr:hypothetical protein [Nocardioidaceae bacterium]
MILVSAGDPITAADINRAATKVIGIGESTSSQTAVGSTSNTLMDSITVTLVAGRAYWVYTYVPYQGNTANDNFYVLMYEDSTSGTQMTYRTVRILQTTRVAATTLRRRYVAAASGSKTFVTAFRRADGSGTFQPVGATGQVRILSVESAD